jgi:hypothetical protein
MDNTSLMNTSPLSVISPTPVQRQVNSIGFNEFIQQLPLVIKERKANKENGAENKDPVHDLLE